MAKTPKVREQRPITVIKSIINPLSMDVKTKKILFVFIVVVSVVACLSVRVYGLKGGEETLPP